MEEHIPQPEEVYWQMSELFKVFSDCTRLRIMDSLCGEELTVSELVKRLFLTQSTVSHQLAILRQNRLVRCRREGKTMVYALADDHVLTILKQGLEHISE